MANNDDELYNGEFKSPSSYLWGSESVGEADYKLDEVLRHLENKKLAMASRRGEKSIRY